MHILAPLLHENRFKCHACHHSPAPPSSHPPLGKKYFNQATRLSLKQKVPVGLMNKALHMVLQCTLTYAPQVLPQMQSEYKLQAQGGDVDSSDMGGRWEPSSPPQGAGTSAGPQPRLQQVPVFPKRDEQQCQQQAGGHALAALHQRRDEAGQRGHEHQQHGHEGQNHVDELPQQGPGGPPLNTLQLHHLLLLLL